MSIQRGRSTGNLAQIILLYFCMQLSASRIPDDDPFAWEAHGNAAKYYFVNKQLNAPKLGHHLPMRWPDNSAKIRTGRTKGLEVNGMCCPELAVTPKNLSNKSLPWTSGPSYWQPILDGTIIAAIGGLFTKRIKDESNRERLERMKLREMQLLKNLTKLIDDFAEFDTLRRESEKVEKHINQEIR